MFGVPDHRNPEYGALKHLRALLEAAVRKSKCDHRELRLTIASSKPNCKFMVFFLVGEKPKYQNLL